MNDKHNGEQNKGLSAEEREQLERYDSLSREMNPPAELETAVASELRRQGLIGTRRARAWGWPGIAWGVAPSLATLALGLFIGMSWVQEAATPTDDSPLYMLILRGGDAFQPDSPRINMRREYGSWAMNLLPRGSVLSGAELENLGWALRRSEGEIVTSDVGSEKRRYGDIAGFFLIRAQDSEAAVNMARTSPHLKYGGTVEIWPVVADAEDAND